MRILAGTVAAILMAAAANAQSMNAEEFHRRATALQKKGPLALFSSDVKLLTNEGKAAGQAARERRLATIKAGQKPRYCPPEGKRSMGSDEFMKRLEAIPPAERAKIDMGEAMTRMLEKKFPCPAS